MPRTATTDRFVQPSADHPVELNHDLRVTELVADVPSVGMVSAYIDVLIREATIPIISWSIEFHNETTVDGAIALFDKLTLRIRHGQVIPISIPLIFLIPPWNPLIFMNIDDMYR